MDTIILNIILVSEILIIKGKMNKSKFTQYEKELDIKSFSVEFENFSHNIFYFPDFFDCNLNCIAIIIKTAKWILDDTIYVNHFRLRNRIICFFHCLNQGWRTF